MNKEEFIKEVNNLGLKVDNSKLLLLDSYYQMLIIENKKYNLTRITNIEDVYLKHFYDSLTLTKIIDLDKKSICDIGSGAGFPGIVLAIFFPHSNLTLIESNNKKCNFLNMIKKNLNLNNVTIINDRTEDYSKKNRELFDVVTARAVAPLKHILEYGIPLVKTGGYLVPMKSNLEKEMNNIENYYRKLNIIEEDKIIFNLPIENSFRTLIKYHKEKETDLTYPRKYSEMLKKDI